MSDWWESAPLAPASDPSFNGYIPGVPKPKDNITWTPLSKDQAAASGLDPSFTWQKSSSGEIKKVGDAGDPQKDVLGDAIKGLGIDELVQNVGKARKAIDGGYATGITGAVLSRVPGTSASDFHGYIDAIQGGIILEKLNSLKEASKTGASGLGALSEKEGERLAASVAAIKPNMSDQALKDSLDAIEQHANFLRAVQEGKDPRDPNVAKAYNLAGVPALAAAPNGGGDGPPGATNLNDDQKKAYAAFIASHNGKPDPGSLKTFLEGLTGKTVTNADDIAASLAKGQPANTSVEDLTHEQKVAKRQGELEKNGLGRTDALGLGVADSLTLGSADEINAFGGALRDSLAGRGSFSDNYGVNVDANRGLMRDLQTEHPAYYIGGQLAGGAVLAPLAPVGEAETLGALARTGAKGGAAYGALYGFNSGTDAESRLTGAGTGLATGATVGALAPYAATAVGKAVSPLIPRRFKAPLGMNPELADASQAEGVDLMQPMVDPTKISDYGALESNVYSQPIIRGAAGRVRGQIEDRVQALGADGTALESDAAGNVVQGMGSRFIQRSKGVANRLYDQARKAAGDARFVPQKAIEQVDAELASLAPNAETNAGEIKFLEGLKSDLSSGDGKTVDELRQLRTSLRGRVNEQNLGATQAEARAIRALDATQQDVAANVPEAASAFRRADTYYRERQTHIDDIIRRITGGKVGANDYQVSGEQAFQRIKSMASPGGDGRRLAALMRDLEPNERQDIAATIAQGLGRRSPDEPFSTALLISQTRKLSPSARKTIFGPDGAQSIDNLRLLSQKLGEAEKDINRSRSATVLERQGIRTAARAFISGLAGIGGTAATGSIGGGIAGMAVAGGAMGASAARRVLSARAMVNPRVSRWMAEAADTSTPQQAKEATRKLALIISREPALAHELRPVYDFLENRLALPLAANPDQSGDGNNE